MLDLKEVEMIENELRFVAEQTKVKLVMQPLAGTGNWEFRREVDDGVECLGLMYVASGCVLFRRRLTRKYIWLHEKFWWLGCFLRSASTDSFYQKIGHIQHDDVKRDILGELVRRWCDGDQGIEANEKQTKSGV